jgi:hypothetical protein
MNVLPIPVQLAEQLNDIAPAVDYSLVPTWVVFVTAFVVLSLLGGLVWWLVSRKRLRSVPPQLPRDRALSALAHASAEIDAVNLYQFSILVSDILRRYVTDQYGLPVTRQTSIEFLEGLRRGQQFSADEKILLEDFLSRCDLIKFARYDATSADSHLLLEEATRFVKGGHVELASV